MSSTIIPDPVSWSSQLPLIDSYDELPMLLAFFFIHVVRPIAECKIGLY